MPTGSLRSLRQLMLFQPLLAAFDFASISVLLPRRWFVELSIEDESKPPAMEKRCPTMTCEATRRNESRQR